MSGEGGGAMQGVRRQRNAAQIKGRGRTGSPTSSPSPPLFRILALAGILAACLAAYGASLRYDFVSDDLHLIVDRLPAYQKSFPIAEAFSHNFWKGGAYGALPGEAKDYYRPLVTLSYAADARIWGARAFGFRLTNLLLHAVASWLVMLLLLRLGIGRAIALAAALLFALHPIHVSNVAWISGRTDLLCAVFLLIAYDRIVDSIDRRATIDAGPGSVRAFGIGLLAYGLALLSKEMAFSLVGLLALHAYLRRAEASRSGRPLPRWPWIELGGVVAVTVAFVLFRAAVLGLPDFGSGARSAAVPFRLGALPAILTYYWRVLFLPAGLQLEVPFGPVSSALDPRVIVGSVMLALQVVAAVILSRRGRIAGFGLGWMLVTLLPVSHLVPLVFRAIVTEYWLYIPSIGFVTTLAACVPWALGRIRRGGTGAPARGARHPGRGGTGRPGHDPVSMCAASLR